MKTKLAFPSSRVLLLGTAACSGEAHLHFEPGRFPVAARDRSPAGLDAGLDDGKPQTDASGGAVARGLQPVERLKDRIELAFGNAGSLVGDAQV